MATWPSGKAEACKAFTPGSNPGVASKHADVAQLVEHDLAKVGVAGSNPVVRSNFTSRLRAAFFMLPLRSRVPRSHVEPLAQHSTISPPWHKAIQSQRPTAMNSFGAASEPFDANKHPPRLPDPGFRSGSPLLGDIV